MIRRTPRSTLFPSRRSSDLPESPLLELDNVLLTPHSAGPTWQSFPRRFANCFANIERVQRGEKDRKSTRLNSSHPSISYAVFCLKKKKVSAPACWGGWRGGD